MPNVLSETLGFLSDFATFRAKLEADQADNIAVVNKALQKYYNACRELKWATLRGERAGFPRLSDPDVTQALATILNDRDIIIRTARTLLWASCRSGESGPFWLGDCRFREGTYRGESLCANEWPVGTYGYMKVIDAAADALRQGGIEVVFVRYERKIVLGDEYPCTGSCPTMCDGGHRGVVSDEQIRHTSSSLLQSGCHYQETSLMTVEISPSNRQNR